MTDVELSEIASSLNNLAVKLSSAGRRVDALSSIREAANLYRKLADAQPSIYLPDLARTLNNLAINLSWVGRRTEAVAVAEEAVNIRRRLAEAAPDTYLPDLATSLNNLANRLTDTGQRTEAVAVAEEAVDIRRRLAEAAPDAYLPDLATSLNNLAYFLADTGRQDDAVVSAEEAGHILKRLADAAPSAYLPSLVISNIQLGELAEQRGDYSGAEQRYHVALTISEEIGDRATIARIYHQLGTLAQQRQNDTPDNEPFSVKGVQVNYFLGVPDIPVTRRVNWPIQVGAVPSLADSFQSRIREAAMLVEAMHTDRAGAVTQVVSGMAGVGKSQLAAAYARESLAAGWLQLIVWATATSREAILASYAETAVQLGYTGRGGAEEAASWFLDWLQTSERDWLIVLDNLTDPYDLRGLWPDGPRGQTLVTTRRRDVILSGRERQRIDVSVFSADEARAYLAEKIGADAKSDRMQQADELAADLGYLPLALAQAAAFIVDRGETCAGYRARLIDRRRHLSDLFPADALADDYLQTISATWSMSVEAADQMAPMGLSRPLLQVISVLDPNGVPIDIVETDAVVEYVSANLAALKGEAGSSIVTISGRDCSDALINLVRMSLISVASFEGSRTVLVHALFQRATIENLSSSQLKTAIRAAADGLEQIWLDVERDFVRGRLLQENAQVLARRQVGALWDPEGHPLLLRTGRDLGESGLVSAAVSYWAMLAEDGERILGPDHPQALDARGNLAYWRGEAGDPAGAAAAFEQLLSDQLRVLGPDHPQTLTTRHNLARWRGEAGE